MMMMMMMMYEIGNENKDSCVEYHIYIYIQQSINQTMTSLAYSI